MHLSTFGWNPFFERHGTALRAQGLRLGRVSCEERGLYRLYTEQGEQKAWLGGRLRHEAAGRADLPAAGDWVAFREEGGACVLQAVLPRRSKFSRKQSGRAAEEQIIAANIDKALLLTGLDNDYNLRRMERYLALTWESGAQPVVVLNKTDLCPDVPARVAEAGAVAPGVPVYAISSLLGEGLEQLVAEIVPRETLAVLGSSGVGKSTLINRLLGADVLATAAVRASDGRGRHTTTARRLILLPSGALVMDTPGMRELQIWEDDEGIGRAFDEIETLAAECAFSDCTHRSEPRCAVKAAVEDGRLWPARLENFRKLQREMRYLERRQDHAAQLAEKRRWKSIHKSMRGFDKRK